MDTSKEYIKMSEKKEFARVKWFKFGRTIQTAPFESATFEEGDSVKYDHIDEEDERNAEIERKKQKIKEEMREWEEEIKNRI